MKLQDKKGFIFAAFPFLMVAVSILVLIFGIVFTWKFFTSAKMILLTVGGGLMVLTFIYAIPAALKENFTKQKAGFVLALIGIGLVIVLIGVFGVQQSYLSVSSVSVGADGKAYWLLTGSADNIDEGYTFNYKPTNYTLSNGNIVSPQKALNLYVSKSDSSCKYTLQPIVISRCLGLVKTTYYIPSNPERIALMNIRDGNGQTTTMDATMSDSKTIADVDGKGSVTIKTQGIFAGKTDCPSNTNVAFMKFNEGWKTYFQNQLDANLQGWSCLSPLSIIWAPKNSENNQFTSAFLSAPTFTDTEVKGNINIGNGVFTITADQDYFNSVVLMPPKDVKPFINDISIPTLKTGSAGSMVVVISNQEANTQGIISVKADSSSLSITPSQQNVALKTNNQVYFNVMAQSTASTNNIVTITACSTGQFGPATCSTKTQTFDIITTQPNSYCGDKICQANENSATCATDCNNINPYNNTLPTCNSFQTIAYTNEAVYGVKIFGIGIGHPKIITKPICKTSDWVWGLIIGFFLTILIIVTVFLLLPPKSKKSKK